MSETCIFSKKSTIKYMLAPSFIFRFKIKDSNIRISFGFQNFRIRIFKIRGKRFESEFESEKFVHLCLGWHHCHLYVQL